MPLKFYGLKGKEHYAAPNHSKATKSIGNASFEP